MDSMLARSLSQQAFHLVIRPPRTIPSLMKSFCSAQSLKCLIYYEKRWGNEKQTIIWLLRYVLNHSFCPILVSVNDSFAFLLTFSAKINASTKWDEKTYCSISICSGRKNLIYRYSRSLLNFKGLKIHPVCKYLIQWHENCDLSFWPHRVSRASSQLQE